MTSMEVEDIGRFGIENETDGPFLGFLLLPHFAGHIVTVTQLVCKSLTFTVEQETTLTT